jgi:hypothetical protein
VRADGPGADGPAGGGGARTARLDGGLARSSELRRAARWLGRGRQRARERGELGRERARGGRKELGLSLFIERVEERAPGGENGRPWPLTAINSVVNGEKKWGREKKRRRRFPAWDTDGRGPGRARARRGRARRRRHNQREEGEGPRGPDGWVPPVTGREGGGARARG